MESLTVDAFLSWLAMHRDDEIVGCAGQCFHSPLARFLSWQAGRAMGVDGSRYGWALADYCFWRELPRWARVFMDYSDTWFSREMTAWQALEVLIRVEAVVAPVVLVG